MKVHLPLALALLMAGPAAARAQSPLIEPPTMPWQVVNGITSGNVIDVRGAGLVRLAGIDDAGEMSRAFLAGLISSQAVRVIATTYSSGGMTEAFVYVPDGRCVNVEMLRHGYARVRVTPGFERSAEFRGLQEDAQRLKRGLWAPPETVRAAASPLPHTPTPQSTIIHRAHLAAGGGRPLGGDRDWFGLGDAGVFVSHAFGFYLSAGYASDIGDDATAGADRAWHGSAGVKIASPAQAALRPYLRAGGGYMRVESGEPATHDRPFWEAGAGLIVAGGPLHADLGYTYARVDGLPVTRVFGLLGFRF